MDWTTYYPAFRSSPAESNIGEQPILPPKISKDVEVADIGCGFGGLLVALAPKLPDTLMLGKLFKTLWYAKV